MFPKHKKYYPGAYADEVSRKKLHAGCWKLVSEIVRKSRIIKYGVALCYTCGKKLHWKDLQCGHYSHSGNDCWSLLDFYFDNLRPQCARCNKYLDGNLGVYGPLLKAEIGEERFDKINLVKHDINRMTVDDYKELKAKLKKQLEKVNEEKLKV